MNLGEIVVKGFSMIKEQTDSIIGELKATRESIDTLAKYARNIDGYAESTSAESKEILGSVIENTGYLKDIKNSSFVTQCELNRIVLNKKGLKDREER